MTQQKFDVSGRTIVVKYGGAAMQSPELKSMVMDDIAVLKSVGALVVLVHGGGPVLSLVSKELGKETKFVDGLRYTDAETVEIAVMVLSGKVSKELVSLLEKKGVKSLGICGIDGSMLVAVKKEKPDLGFVGEVTKVDTKPITVALDAGYTPVIASLAIGKGGQIFNVNADTAASEIAIALKADFLIQMSDVKGLLLDKDDESTLVSEISIPEIGSLISDGTIAGGMIPKILGSVDAVTRGVSQVAIIDGREEHALLREFSEGGIGTRIINEGKI
ncbi:MAG: acetylglutamate kinase [Clostridiales Family XIII bacterium]|jgi:acetylglutamate kinase|nr:acetylglutamate kinase [Clostridiales Family XIII bacterium]